MGMFTPDANRSKAMKSNTNTVKAVANFIDEKAERNIAYFFLHDQKIISVTGREILKFGNKRLLPRNQQLSHYSYFA